MGRATLFRAVLFLSLLRAVYFIDVRRCARTAFELAASASALPLCTHATHTCPRPTRHCAHTDRLAPRVLPQAPAAVLSLDVGEFIDIKNSKKSGLYGKLTKGRMITERVSR